MEGLKKDMRDYTVIADSCTDYIVGKGPLDDVRLVPLTIEVGSGIHVDDATLDCGMLITTMANCKEAPKSACPAPSAFDAAIGASDECYIVTLSENVSGTYNSAVMGAKLALERNPLRKIHVFNSKTAAAGEVAVCEKIKDFIRRGLVFDEVVARTERFVGGLTTLFVLETLEVFRKSGRLSHLQSIATAALKIKLIMGADKNGNIAMRGKALSMSRALDNFVKLVKQESEKADEEHDTLYITHCACLDRAMAVKEQIAKQCSFKDIVICEARGISTMYANEGGIIAAF